MCWTLQEYEDYGYSHRRFWRWRHLRNCAERDLTVNLRARIEVLINGPTVSVGAQGRNFLSGTLTVSGLLVNSVKSHLNQPKCILKMSKVGGLEPSI
jgi:hypothetical protein